MNLSTMTQEALTELYDKYIPQFDNTYKVEIFPYGNSSSIKGINLDTYICFHATKVSFNGESLSLERDFPLGELKDITIVHGKYSILLNQSTFF